MRLFFFRLALRGGSVTTVSEFLFVGRDVVVMSSEFGSVISDGTRGFGGLFNRSKIPESLR